MSTQGPTQDNEHPPQGKTPKPDNRKQPAGDSSRLTAHFEWGDVKYNAAFDLALKRYCEQQWNGENYKFLKAVDDWILVEEDITQYHRQHAPDLNELMKLVRDFIIVKPDNETGDPELNLSGPIRNSIIDLYTKLTPLNLDATMRVNLMIPLQNALAKARNEIQALMERDILGRFNNPDNNKGANSNSPHTIANQLILDDKIQGLAAVLTKQLNTPQQFSATPLTMLGMNVRMSRGFGPILRGLLMELQTVKYEQDPISKALKLRTAIEACLRKIADKISQATTPSKAQEMGKEILGIVNKLTTVLIEITPYIRPYLYQKGVQREPPRPK